MSERLFQNFGNLGNQMKLYKTLCIIGIALMCCPFYSFAQKKKQPFVWQESSTDTCLYFGLQREMPVFLNQARESLSYPMAWQNQPKKAKYKKWREAARQVVFDCMGTLPPAPAQFDSKIIDSEDRGNYIAYKIEFNISAWERIPAYLLKPKGEGPFPAVVMLHDHGAKFSIGKEKMVKPFRVSEACMQEAEKWSVQCYDGSYAGDFYASKGYVVLAIDAIFWGERGRKEGVDYDGQQALAANLQQLGMSLCGVITADDIRSAEFLQSLDYVDKDRLFCLGFSMGAHRAWMLNACSDVVKGGVAICWITNTDQQMSSENHRNTGGSVYTMSLPFIRNYLDFPHVASIACPKPMYFINGSSDKLFPVKGVQESYDTMREVWESQGHSKDFRAEIWDSPHFFSRKMQEATLEFLNQY